jgi:hypothetical protein
MTGWLVEELEDHMGALIGAWDPTFGRISSRPEQPTETLSSRL